MTQEQKDNLLKLATYLLSGDLKAAFNMRRFTDSLVLDFEALRTDCGTVGCTAGHGPYAGIPKEFGEGWGNYILRSFGVHVMDDAWDFLFSVWWSETDNTPTGAAKRILYFLKYGVPDKYVPSENEREMVELYKNEQL